MKTVAIVQARWNSSRFPGKVLKKIDNLSVLGHVINKLEKTVGVDTICCAIPNNESSKKIKFEVQKYKVEIYEGSMNDVLSRFYGAARKYEADYIFRVTSDCPLTDVKLNSKVIDEIKKNKLQYVTNNMPPSFPHGLDCEVFSFSILEKAYLKAKTLYEREHVTPWIKKNSKSKNITNPLGNYSNIRITLDYKDDLVLIKKINFLLKQMKKEINFINIIELFNKDKTLSNINLKHNKFPQ